MSRPSVMFVCVKNGGKSQMAAALMRHEAGDAVEVRSAGTHPGGKLNAQSVESLAEIGVGVGDEHPKPIDPAVLAATDLVVLVGTDARLDTVPAGVKVHVWDTDEPSHRGIEGMERMRLVRNDIRARVRALVDELAH
jgi:arsenate-mycothiol transferase|uniref:arsenate-mycothiol transferase ArsC n=1 Tax=Pigmentiphaga litoralis TaxID=516702 RepID=UPI00389B0176